MHFPAPGIVSNNDDTEQEKCIRSSLKANEGSPNKSAGSDGKETEVHPPEGHRRGFFD